MAKKSGPRQFEKVTIYREHEAPTIYTNHCELGVILDEFRIIFREALDADPATGELRVRELLRVYCNIHTARQLAGMFVTAVRQYDEKHAPKPSSSAEKPSP